MRSMWKGSVSFGLVNIPVKMYAATQEKRVRFNQLHALCHQRIKYEKVCTHCERPVDAGEVVRGYPYGDGQYVIISDREWEGFFEPTSKTIEILRFVEIGEIDPIYFNKTYFLEPVESGGKAYQLLKNALARAGKIGVAKIIIRSKSSLAVLRVYHEILAIETIFYPDEIRDHSPLGVGAGAAVEKKELEMALSLIAGLTEPFRPEQYRDEHRLAILGLIEKKIQGQELVETPASKEDFPAVDLMAALRASLQAQENKTSDFPREIKH